MNKTKGIICAVLAAVIYGFTPILGKLTYLEGSNTLSLAFYRNLLTLPILYAILKKQAVPLSVNKSESVKLSMLGILGPSITALMLYGAYNYISVGMTTTIHYIYPVLVTIVCIVFFKEKISRDKIISLILSTIGISLFFEGNLNLVGILLALMSGMSYGAFLILVDKSGIKGMYPFKFSLYTCVFASIFLFFVGIMTNTLTFNMTIKGWLYTFLVSLFVSVLANTLIPIAVKNTGSAVTAIVGMFEPITSVIFGILFLNEPFTIRNSLGCMLIIAAVILLTLAKEKPQRI